MIVLESKTWLCNGAQVMTAYTKIHCLKPRIFFLASSETLQVSHFILSQIPQLNFLLFASFALALLARGCFHQPSFRKEPTQRRGSWVAKLAKLLLTKVSRAKLAQSSGSHNLMI